MFTEDITVQKLRSRLPGRFSSTRDFASAVTSRRFPGAPNRLIAFAESARRAATPGAINSCPSAVQRPPLLGNKAIDSSRPRGPLVSRYATRRPTTSSEKSLWEIDIRPGFLIRKCLGPRYAGRGISSRFPFPVPSATPWTPWCFSLLPRRYLGNREEMEEIGDGTYFTVLTIGLSRKYFRMFWINKFFKKLENI